MTDTAEPAPAAHEVWPTLTIRRPRDVPGGTPLLWMAERHSEHSHRLANRDLPADFPHPVERGDAGDALAVLALGVEIERAAARWRAITIRTALECGATLRQVADALDNSPEAVRTDLLLWADSQHNLWCSDAAAGRERPLGIDAEAWVRIVALARRGDNDTED